MTDTPSIYEWGGGRGPFERWLNLFYDLVEREAPEIAALFGGTVSAEHREHVTDWWTEVMGVRRSTRNVAGATKRCWLATTTSASPLNSASSSSPC